MAHDFVHGFKWSLDVQSQLISWSLYRNDRRTRSPKSLHKLIDEAVCGRGVRRSHALGDAASVVRAVLPGQDACSFPVSAVSHAVSFPCV